MPPFVTSTSFRGKKVTSILKAEYLANLIEPFILHAFYIFQLFVQLFEKHYDSLEILAQLEIKKMLLDRLVNLLSRGYVIPVVKYIKSCWEKTDTDISLIR